MNKKILLIFSIIFCYIFNFYIIYAVEESDKSYDNASYFYEVKIVMVKMDTYQILLLQK